jgi:hypothetical protein
MDRFPVSRRRFALVTLAALGLSNAAAKATRVPLFVIERSKNKNVVCYDIVISGDGSTQVKLDVYWRMNAERGQRAELTSLERDFAYGYRVIRELSSEMMSIALKAAPHRALEIVVERTSARAETAILGARARLETVYVETREGGIFPKVVFVELRGRRPSGQPVVERITK